MGPAHWPGVLLAMAAIVIAGGTLQAASLPGKPEENSPAATAVPAPEDTTAPARPAGPRLYVGPFGGVSFTMNTALPSHPSNREYRPGAGWYPNPAVGVHLIWYFQEEGKRSQAFIMRLAYDSRDSDYNIPLPGEVPGNRRYRTSVVYRMMTADFLVTQQLWNSGLRVVAGSSIGIPVGRDLSQFDLPPEEIVIVPSPPYSREWTYPMDSPLYMGLKGGLQYEVPVEPGVTVVPSLLYDFDLLGVHHGEAWRASALQFTMDVRIPL